MKVLLHTENYEQISKSGLGKAIEHQQKALDSQGVDFTTDENEDFDIAHLNTYFPQSFLNAKKWKKNKVKKLCIMHTRLKKILRIHSFFQI